ncbi:efflux RND transporter periplasmic adaptor subunit [Pseudoalteromonas rubra]|uniref:RND transporter n=1 Tax=Pseudoalteromonas rubra TaxID=43658 RepID=A0A0F4QIG3_9GAMM|nr:efflux RND transporter periplasmic adaptor subunit [Pseudoalteromonas rubra]KJZ06442.1 RND transporter [Pseudoalteromonas rubra]
MDKKITTSRNTKLKKSLIWAGLCGSLLSISYAYQDSRSQGQTQTIDQSTLVHSEVIRGTFTEQIRLRASIAPKRAILLDTLSGGRVEEKHVEPGDFVTKGQPLVRLSNMSLQLDVISREAQVTEQLNFLRNTQMTMENNKLNLRRDLLEIEHQIQHLKRKLNQALALQTHRAITKDQIATLEQDLSYYEQRRELTLQRQKAENEIRNIQIEQLEDSAQMLQKNLAFARKNLEDLLVRAPADGYVSELAAEIGESKARGDRLGQIDIPDMYKLVAEVDEYYLNQVTVDMQAIALFDGQPVALTVTKIDSRVKDAKFQVELDLPTELTQLKRGQSVDLELHLGDAQASTLMLRRGAFFSASGGNWVFVLDKESNKAIRKSIRLGKKNNDYFEVLSGLNAGDVVITSSYSAFNNADTLMLN